MNKNETTIRNEPQKKADKFNAITVIFSPPLQN